MALKGVGLKDRNRKALRKKAGRGFSGYPVATVAYYGPDDKFATKVAVGIILGEGQDPVFLERWFSEDTDIRKRRGVDAQIIEFIGKHKAKSVVIADRIMGCPHEEGKDYPEGSKCPHCPFWEHRDRWSGAVVH